ncbi:PREDICTED: uncharacterized protein LOC107332789 [Acropora digitifera]|nr:PREDICTED: uncharacterized protein LOC107332789 [Acropora digitifera]
MANTSTGPSYIATPAISPTLAAQPSDISDIPLGPLLNSLAVTKPPLTMKPTKPPLLHLLKTSSPKPAPAQETTKPTYVTVSTNTKPTAKKPKKWGFGDKYLASQNERARHRNVIFDGIAGDSMSLSNYQVLSQQEVFFPRKGRK